MTNQNLLKQNVRTHKRFFLKFIRKNFLAMLAICIFSQTLFGFSGLYSPTTASAYAYNSQANSLIDQLEPWYNIKIRGNWTYEELLVLNSALYDSQLGVNGNTHLKRILDGATFRRVDYNRGLAGQYDQNNNTITIADSAFDHSDGNAHWVIMHEVGHRLDFYLGWESDHIYTEIAGAAPGTPYIQKTFVSPYDEKISVNQNAETFAQAFASAFFSGNKYGIQEKLVPYDKSGYGEPETYMRELVNENF